MFQLIKVLVKLVESKLVKSGLEELILKNQNYFDEGVKIWKMVDENYRISQTIEEKLVSKIEEFNKYLLAKFPELTQSDIDGIRQEVAGELNRGKEEVVSSSTLLQQLQSSNSELTNTNNQLQITVQTLNQQISQLQNEKQDLQNKLSTIQSAISVASQQVDTTTASPDNTQPIPQA